MADLKSAFEAIGFDDVRTYINSGNIIFSSQIDSESEIVHRIERCIKENFDLDIPVVIRSQSEIAEVVGKIPENWVNDQAMRTDVIFLWAEVDRPDVLNEIAIKSICRPFDIHARSGHLAFRSHRLSQEQDA